MTHLRQAMLEELRRRNYAKTTIEYYLQTVEQFAKYFRKPPDQLNQEHIRIYQSYLLHDRKLHPHSVKRHVAALRFFFVKTLRRPYGLDDTPYPRVPRRLPTILTVEEVTRLIDAARTLTDRTMLMVLYSTGMRNAEMRSLQVQDIDSRSMLIHIQRGKGGRDRYVRPAQRDASADAPRVLALDEAEDMVVSRHDGGVARRQADHAEGRVGCLSVCGAAREYSETRFSACVAPFIRDASS